MISFEILTQEGNARTGRLVTPHGEILTPCFVPVGTFAAVRALSVDDLKNARSQVLITNSLHLHLRPGEKTIERLGGLHRFMGWEGPLITDSGGFQIFSLGEASRLGIGKIASVFPGPIRKGKALGPKKKKPMVRVHEGGVEFVSYLDGSTHCLTPEAVMEIGRRLAADLMLVLDECTSPHHDHDYTRRAMQRTHHWARRALEIFSRGPSGTQGLMGIVQGGAFRDLRRESAEFLSTLDFHGYAIGGSLGKSKEEMFQVLDWTVPYLPAKRPRHLLGIGEIEDIFEVVDRGIDLFDCIFPTQMACTGTFFSKNASRFRIHILNARFKNDPRPVEEDCTCPTCLNHSRAYLRHLFHVREPLGVRLCAIHNLSFLEGLMREIREAIRNQRFQALRKGWMASARHTW